jgi:hypothetical protein
LWFVRDDVSEESEHRAAAWIPAQHLAGSVRLELKPAACKVAFGERPARVDAGVPKVQRGACALYVAVGPGGLRARLRPASSAICGLPAVRVEPEPVCDVALANVERIARVAVHKKAERRACRQPYRKAAIAPTMVGPRRQHLAATNHAAQGGGDGAKIADHVRAQLMARQELRDRPLADRQRIAKPYADAAGRKFDDDLRVAPADCVKGNAGDLGGLAQGDYALQLKVRPKLGLSIREHFASPLHCAIAR